MRHLLLLGLFGLLWAACASTPVEKEGEAPSPSPAAPSVPESPVLPPPAAPPESPAWADVDLPAWVAPPSPALLTEIIEQTGRLTSEDFAEHARAARRLVAIGSVAVPFLGSFGDREVEEKGARGRARLVLAPIFRRMEPAEVGLWMRSPHATTRAAAARAAGHGPYPEHARALLELLEDGDLRVRREAVAALRRMTDRFFGYRPEDSPERRRKAVERWRESWGPG